jgi:FtsH-binding integral membrane protein
MDYVIATLFSLYIAFDWARANKYPKTVNNAIASAFDIYYDIVNLFLRVLSIMGKRD